MDHYNAASQQGGQVNEVQVMEAVSCHATRRQLALRLTLLLSWVVEETAEGKGLELAGS